MQPGSSPPVLNCEASVTDPTGVTTTRLFFFLSVSSPSLVCCVHTGREDAPAPSCPGIDVVMAGLYVDFLPCQRCAWSFANNPEV